MSCMRQPVNVKAQEKIAVAGIGKYVNNSSKL